MQSQAELLEGMAEYRKLAGRSSAEKLAVVFGMKAVEMKRGRERARGGEGERGRECYRCKSSEHLVSGFPRAARQARKNRQSFACLPARNKGHRWRGRRKGGLSTE